MNNIFHNASIFFDFFRYMFDKLDCLLKLAILQLFGCFLGCLLRHFRNFFHRFCRFFYYFFSRLKFSCKYKLIYKHNYFMNFLNFFKRKKKEKMNRNLKFACLQFLVYSSTVSTKRGVRE